MFFLAFQRIHFCKTKETSFVLCKKRKTECAGNPFSFLSDPQSTCSPPHPCSVPQKARLGFHVNLANSRRFKSRRRKTRALIPLVVSWPIVPVQSPLHSTQCWGGPALLCPSSHRGGNGTSLCLWSVTIFSWFPHPAHILVNRPLGDSPLSPLSSIPSFASLAEGRIHVPRGTPDRVKYMPTALAVVPPLTSSGQEAAELWRRLAINCENGRGLFPQVCAQGCSTNSFSLYGATPL